MVKFAKLFQETFADRDLIPWGFLERTAFDGYLEVRQLPVTALLDLTTGVRDTAEAIGSGALSSVGNETLLDSVLGVSNIALSSGSEGQRMTRVLMSALLAVSWDLQA